MSGHTVVLREAYGGSSHGRLLHVAPRAGTPYRVKAQLRQALDTVLDTGRAESYLFSDHQGMRSMTTRRRRSISRAGEPAIRAYETPAGPVGVQLAVRDGVPAVQVHSRPGPTSTAPHARLEVLVDDFTPNGHAPAGWDRGDRGRWMDWMGISPV